MGMERQGKLRKLGSAQKCVVEYLFLLRAPVEAAGFRVQDYVCECGALSWLNGGRAADGVVPFSAYLWGFVDVAVEREEWLVPGEEV